MMILECCIICVSVCVCQLLQSLSGSGIGTASAGGRGGGGEAGEEEPLYVNAKQYQRILKRRQQRARLEQEGRIPKHRMVCVLWFRLMYYMQDMHQAPFGMH